MTKIILTRHGDVVGIRPKRFRGRAQLALTELGERQARALAERVAASWRPAAIYTSPLYRCVTTGERIGTACSVAASTVDDLMDLDYGQWQMRVQDEIKAEQPQLFNLWHTAPQLVRFPGGESLQDLVARTSNALRAVLLAHPGQTVVLVGHDSVNRALLLQLLDQPLSAYGKIVQDPCCLNEIDVEGDHVEVHRVNDTAGIPHG
ncbi:MAG TPA: histidine phosphatase family protein [Reyranella sp.]|jgi:probable phosphoglycerate mutase|nr:histidine phosphatase family protein [Reyranella sp.]